MHKLNIFYFDKKGQPWVNDGTTTCTKDTLNLSLIQRNIIRATQQKYTKEKIKNSKFV